MSEIPPPMPPVAPPIPEEPEPDLVPLDRLPTPPFVLVLCGITLVAFVIGLCRFPSALAVGIDYEKGQRELAAGKNKDAAGHLARVYKAYPKSIDVRLDLADAYFRNSDFQESADIVDSFEENEKVTKEQQAHFEQITSQLLAKAKELGLTDEAGK